ARRRTLLTVAKLTPATLDTPPPAGRNTIGMLLYHIAGAEATWLYPNLQEQPFPPEIAALFPDPIWGEEGLLPPITGWSLDAYLARLQGVREQFLAVYKAMSLEDFRRARRRQGFRGPYEITAETIVAHLMQHEAEHRGQIQALVEWAGCLGAVEPPGG